MKIRKGNQVSPGADARHKRSQMKYLIILTGMLLGLGQLQAQQQQWTLQECIAYAVENNITIEQYTLDLENARIDHSDAVGDMLPNLNASAQILSNTGLSFNPATQDPVTSSVLNVSGNISSSVLLFNGLRNMNNLQRAKLNEVANQYRLDDLVDDIRLNVANAYLQVLSNKESLKVFRAQYAVTEQDLIRTRELVESGVSPRGDLLEIEATAANQEQQIVNAQGLLTLSLINLAQMLQITDYQNFQIAEVDYQVPTTEVLENSPKAIYEKAASFRNDIRFSESRVDLAEKDLTIAKGARYPTLSGFFNYNTAYSDQNDVFGDFFDQLYIFDGISYGLQLNVPIFNGFSVRNSIDRSGIELEKARLQLEQDKLDLETTVNQAYVDVQNAAKTYEAAQKTLEARRLAYDYSRERFDVGLMNAFDYSQAQARVDNAEAEVIRSKYDYIFRIKVLEFFFGLPIVLN